jgi:Zn-dependent protease
MIGVLVGMAGNLGLGVLAMVLHEAGHLAAALALGVKVKSVRACRKGLCIAREAGTPAQNLAVTLAGPMMNLLLLLAVPSTTFRLANLCMLVCNLAPVRNSDGDRVMQCAQLLRRARG